MSKQINLGGREINLDFQEINDLDLQQVLQIDYLNLKDEIQSFPFVVSQLNFLVVEANSLVNKAKFQLDILNSNLEELKAKLFIKTKKELIEGGEKNPTISLIDNQIRLDQSYKDLSESIRCQKQNIAENEKNRDYLSGLYWASQAKLQILVSLSKNIDLS